MQRVAQLALYHLTYKKPALTSALGVVILLPESYIFKAYKNECMLPFCLHRGGGGGGGGWRAAQDRDQIYRYARRVFKILL